MEYSKGQLTGIALLEKAGRLAAKKKSFLQDKTLTDDQIVRKIKPLSSKLRHTNKRLRGLPIGGAGETLEKWMNKMIKNTEVYPKSTQQQPRGDLPKTTVFWRECKVVIFPPPYPQPRRQHHCLPEIRSVNVGEIESERLR